MNFKVGDKLRRTDDSGSCDVWTTGKIYEIVDILPNNMMRVTSNKEPITIGLNTSYFEKVEKSFEFKVGDIVSFGGVEGIVREIITNHSYPVKVSYHNGWVDGFTIDGKIHNWQTEPLLKLIKRPKNKIKKTFRGWMNVYKSPETAFVYPTKEIANKSANPDRIACIEINQEYEIEE